MKEDEKRFAGRPKTGKARIMLSIDPGTLEATDRAAAELGLSRSAYIEVALRTALSRKSPFTK